ncbi:hypothetical protein FRB98_003648 [Tulasnella sp. 332]|nr:hypothetical protein FRB98_003648 [Tulasnella sp. 332]
MSYPLSHNDFTRSRGVADLTYGAYTQRRLPGILVENDTPGLVDEEDWKPKLDAGAYTVPIQRIMSIGEEQLQDVHENFKSSAHFNLSLAGYDGGHLPIATSTSFPDVHPRSGHPLVGPLRAQNSSVIPKQIFGTLLPMLDYNARLFAYLKNGSVVQHDHAGPHLTPVLALEEVAERIELTCGGREWRKVPVFSGEPTQWMQDTANYLWTNKSIGEVFSQTRWQAVGRRYTISGSVLFSYVSSSVFPLQVLESMVASDCGDFHASRWLHAVQGFCRASGTYHVLLYTNTHTVLATFSDAHTGISFSHIEALDMTKAGDIATPVQTTLSILQLTIQAMVDAMEYAIEDRLEFHEAASNGAEASIQNLNFPRQRIIDAPPAVQNATGPTLLEVVLNLPPRDGSIRPFYRYSNDQDASTAPGETDADTDMDGEEEVASDVEVEVEEKEAPTEIVVGSEVDIDGEVLFDEDDAADEEDAREVALSYLPAEFNFEVDAEGQTFWSNAEDFQGQEAAEISTGSFLEFLNYVDRLGQVHDAGQSFDEGPAEDTPGSDFVSYNHEAMALEYESELDPEGEAFLSNSEDFEAHEAADLSTGSFLEYLDYMDYLGQVDDGGQLSAQESPAEDSPGSEFARYTYEAMALEYESEFKAEGETFLSNAGDFEGHEAADISTGSFLEFLDRVDRRGEVHNGGNSFAQESLAEDAYASEFVVYDYKASHVAGESTINNLSSLPATGGEDRDADLNTEPPQLDVSAHTSQDIQIAGVEMGVVGPHAALIGGQSFTEMDVEEPLVTASGPKQPNAILTGVDPADGIIAVTACSGSVAVPEKENSDANGGSRVGEKRARPEDEDEPLLTPAPQISLGVSKPRARRVRLTSASRCSPNASNANTALAQRDQQAFFERHLPLPKNASNGTTHSTASAVAHGHNSGDDVTDKARLAKKRRSDASLATDSGSSTAVQSSRATASGAASGTEKLPSVPPVVRVPGPRIRPARRPTKTFVEQQSSMAAPLAGRDLPMKKAAVSKKKGTFAASKAADMTAASSVLQRGKTISGAAKARSAKKVAVADAKKVAVAKSTLEGKKMVAESKEAIRFPVGRSAVTDEATGPIGADAGRGTGRMMTRSRAKGKSKGNLNPPMTK